MAAVALGGLAVAGGVFYLAEKLINLAKGVGSMMFELVVEKYKQSQREAGIKIGLAKGLEEGQEIGRQEGRVEARQESEREVRAWYERQQAALRAGLPFDEPPPGYSPETPANGKEAG